MTRPLPFKADNTAEYTGNYHMNNKAVNSDNARIKKPIHIILRFLQGSSFSNKH